MAVMKLLKALLWCLAIPFGLWLKAIVGVDLWSWFAVPLGLPAIGLIHALGLSFLVWFWTGGLDRIGLNHEKLSEDQWTRWVIIQFAVLITWGYGAVFNWIGV